jgi:hypothetical protein
VLNQAKIGEGEVASGVVEAASEARDGERLAGGAADEEVDVALLEGPVTVVLQVAEIGGVRIAVRQHGARERINLGHADAAPTERMPRDARSLDARADG